MSAGNCKRLAVFMPPQHGKSESITVRYPAYRLEQTPALRVIVGGYNQRHANKFSRKTRKIVRSRLELSSERKAVGEWDTAAGGGYLAVGVGAGVTGNPADLIIIDDPIKSREEAESTAYRDRLAEWFTDDVYTRKSKDAAIVLIFTRWHEDDLWGRIKQLQNIDDWQVVNLPAEAEENDPLGRAGGEPLCPDLHPLAELLDNRKTMGPAYESLYQGRPTKRGGDIVKTLRIVLITSVPRIANRLRYWDKAATEGDGCYSAGVLLARSPDGLFWIEDVVRGQWSSHQRNQAILQTAQLDHLKYGHVPQWVEQEPGSGGKESAEFSVRLLAGLSVKIDPVRQDKLVRMLPFADQVEAGNVCCLQADWTTDYLAELAAFPRGKHKDQADATSGGFNKLALQPTDPMAVGLPAGHGNVLDTIPRGVFG